jgi:hypothetical protein
MVSRRSSVLNTFDMFGYTKIPRFRNYGIPKPEIDGSTQPETKDDEFQLHYVGPSISYLLKYQIVTRKKQQLRFILTLENSS